MQRRAFTVAVGLVCSLASAVSSAQESPLAALTPKEIAERVFQGYASAKTYAGDWVYTLDQGGSKQTVTMTVRYKAPTRLVMKVALKEAINPSVLPEIPEVNVVVDGTAAWFENASSKEYFTFPLPRNAQVNPLMFFPQLRATEGVERAPDVTVDGKTVIVLQAARADGGVNRMEIDAATMRIRSVSSEAVVGVTKTTSRLEAAKEVLDGEIPDKEFVYKPRRDFKRIESPAGADAIFGPAPARQTEPAKP